MVHVYDPSHDGKAWPKFWEDPRNPHEETGEVCAICQRDVHYEKIHAFHKWVDFDRETAGSGMSVCQSCVVQWGSNTSLKGLSKHDRAIMRRYSAVHNRLMWEIKNGRRNWAVRAY